MSLDRTENHAAGSSAPSVEPAAGKTCRSCLRPLPLAAFYQETRGGHTSYKPDCKVCARHHMAERRRTRKQTRRTTATEKWCPHCTQRRPRGDFRPDARRRDGLHRVCELCVQSAATQAAAPELLPEAVTTLLHQKHAGRQHRISLGLAIAHATCAPGQRRTLEELAAYAGVSLPAMQQIEQQALRKLRALDSTLLQQLLAARAGEEAV